MAINAPNVYNRVEKYKKCNEHSMFVCVWVHILGFILLWVFFVYVYVYSWARTFVCVFRWSAVLASVFVEKPVRQQSLVLLTPGEQTSFNNIYLSNCFTLQLRKQNTKIHQKSIIVFFTMLLWGLGGQIWFMGGKFKWIWSAGRADASFSHFLHTLHIFIQDSWES